MVIRKLKAPKYYELNKWIVSDGHGNKVAQYSVRYKGELLHNQNPLTSLKKARSIIYDHQQLILFRKRKEYYYSTKQ